MQKSLRDASWLLTSTSSLKSYSEDLVQEGKVVFNDGESRQVEEPLLSEEEVQS